MNLFDQKYKEWMQKNIDEENNPRRREILTKGLSHGTVELLRRIWYPAVGHFDYLYPEWEVRDLGGKVRYLDLAYRPHSAKGCIEIQDFRSHARDVDAARFKDLCMKQALLTLEDWFFLPIAYLSIKENPEICKQMILSFVGKFMSMDVQSDLYWAEAESVRFARRLIRSFDADELAKHLNISNRHSRRILHQLVEKRHLIVTSGNQRYRKYQIRL